MNNELLMLIVGCITFVAVVLIVCICMMISGYWEIHRVDISHDEYISLRKKVDDMEDYINRKKMGY